MTGAVAVLVSPIDRGDVVAAAHDLGRSFDGRSVLAGLDLTIRAGEFVALVGRSGSGKSTLLRVLAGLDDQFTGRAEVAHQRMLVFQDARLLPWLRVLDNVTLGLDAAERARAIAVLDDVGLAGRGRSWPKTLSGGEAQRVALARALVRQPRLLLLDEPFGALDAITRRQMRALLRDLHERYRPGTLLVTHDTDEALDLADRVVVLVDGALSHAVDRHEPLALDEAKRRLLEALRLAPPGAGPG